MLRAAAGIAALLRGEGMDDRQESPLEAPDIDKPVVSASPARRRGWGLWLFVIPLAAWLACVGLAVVILIPMVLNPPRMDIPVTGGDSGQGHGKAPVLATQTPKGVAPASPGPTAAPQTAPSVSASIYLNTARTRLDTCAASFHDYFILEQVVVDQPDVFTDPSWRSDATDAMHAFHDDCQALGSLPAAPASLGEIDHWLKLAAAEVGPASDSFTTALEKNQTDQFRASVSHLLKFVDYIHNAEGALDGIKQRKEI